LDDSLSLTASSLNALSYSIRTFFFDIGTPPWDYYKITFSGEVHDVEAVQLRTVQTVRQLEEAGQITIVRGDSNDKFV
jgi:hypothetical protein